jgi:hypothetical protein
VGNNPLDGAGDSSWRRPTASGPWASAAARNCGSPASTEARTSSGAEAKSFHLTCGHNMATLWLMTKSKRDGRPANVKPLKDDMVRMRVSAGDKKALTEAANRVGLELSVWLRQLAFRAAGLLPESK